MSSCSILGAGASAPRISHSKNSCRIASRRRFRDVSARCYNAIIVSGHRKKSAKKSRSWLQRSSSRNGRRAVSAASFRIYAQVERPALHSEIGSAAVREQLQVHIAPQLRKQIAKEGLLEREAWELLRQAVVSYNGKPVGTKAANVNSADGSVLNYDQVFVRDFIPSGVAFLLKGEPEIVKEFLLCTLKLQSCKKTLECHNLGKGSMPASFKVQSVPGTTEEVLDADFGGTAIGRVTPVDSGLWWIILLRAYWKSTGDLALVQMKEIQTGMQLILELCLADGFDAFPTLLVTDGSCMIDRRMGIHGHPLEIQALFYSALRCARELLTLDASSEGIFSVLNSRLDSLSFHLRQHYWLDMAKLNKIYRYKTEEYSHDAINKFNIYPDQIPSWLLSWLPEDGGFFVGNLQPAHMDFRFFTLGNLWAIVGSLATFEQSQAILDLFEGRWADLIESMPLKICYPALEAEEWRIITGADPKNTPWSYHNGGSWPTLVWQFTLACIKVGRSELAVQGLEIMEKRISRDRWPEYYDTRSGKLIGKQARLHQTWSIAGYIVAKQLLANPDAAKLFTFDEELELSECCVH